MVVIPAGAFTMGSPVTEPDRYAFEGPQHLVRFEKPFAVSKLDVTFADWDACASVGGCPAIDSAGMGRGDKPVINVSWNDANLYVTWFAMMSGKPYRLLSEAEWEYSARAGATTPFLSGDDIGFGNANCDGCGSQWDDMETSPTGAFSPNPFQLYDMEGNVWQWVGDCFNLNYLKAPVDGSVWNSGKCDRRVIRGGSWLNHPKFLRLANRYGYGSDFRASDIGFRIARSIEQ